MASAESGPPGSTSVPDEQIPRLFQCSTCKRSFTRVDHLTRHVRAHTRQKPYICPTCSKGFARVDLLKRHAVGHSTEQSTQKQKRETVRPSRVIQACDACAQNHLRCEDEKPCSRCRKRDIPCRTALPEDLTELGSELDTVSAAQGLLDFSNNFEHPTITDEANRPKVNLTGATESQMSIQTDAQPPENQSMESEASMPSYEDNPSQFTHQVDVMDDDPFALDNSHLMPLEEPFFSGQCTPRGIMDASFNWNIDLNDFDIGFLDQYSLEIPFNVETPSTDAQGPEPDSSNLPPEGVAVRHEAFKRSVWRYLPQRNRDFGGAEQPNLALDNAHHHPRTPPRRAIQERLGRVTRDKLMAFVLGTCSPVNVSRIASAFPSVELLDGLIQYFLTSPSLDAKAWFHLPTFSPSSLRPELLAIVIAAGAISTPDVPLCKLGFALHEASRTGSSKAFEEDNSAIRDLQSIQTLLMLLEIGMWSGISRKMEISESFMQPLVTMLRRGGRFRRSTWKEICPHPDDTGLTLDNKWKEWVAEESYVRLVYRAFEHDRQSSMALLKPPLISYAEMQLPLTQPEPLWEANTADMWKTLCLSDAKEKCQRPSPIDCLSDLEFLSLHDMASSAYVYMAWGMVWNFRQMSSLSSQSPLHRANTVLVSSRHQELTRSLEDFRVSSPILALGSGSTVEIVLELMLVHLNAPLEEIQLYAGIEGQDEARRVLPVLKRWIDTSSARQALWHSGQVLRAATKLPRGLLRNFNAIAVYHAGLILWGYGLLKSTPSSTNDSGQCVHMDGTDNITVRRFITLDRGFPALSAQDEKQSPVLLMDTRAVMNSLVHLLRANHDAKDGSSAPLVENLVHLMEGLRPAKS
ncbi:hypothetical protein P154DRAFT_486746 [Amniculicola lignicola CBS 123094]|uniref:C6 transcription factor RegA n=1 Tax=Amniculicola lignicola CBS 123094 TaxID=1392246 RepID=A0A6A5WRE0_9PLEO|nr:hypothetical protein P154DRAFT_486746 [Amniculicola lignicola CBS 123094]